MDEAPAASTPEERLRQLEATVRVLEARLAALEAGGPAPAAAAAAPAAPAAPPRDLELHLGTWWLSRLGVVALITGVAFLVIYRFGLLGVWLRIAAGYALAGGLAALGLWLARRHRTFGQTLFGGGLALGYFVTYALHFVPAVRVVHSELLALLLVGLAIAAIVWVAHRMQSETVAGISLFLGLHTGMLSDVTAFTLLATCLLAAGAVFFLVANRWVVVPLSGLLAVYSTHASWMDGQGAGAPVALSLAFLTLYFLLFSVALLLRPEGLSARTLVAFPVLNALGLGALGWTELAEASRGAHALLLAALSLVHFALAALQARRPLPRTVSLALALGAAGLALQVQLEGVAQGVVLALLSLGAAAAARRLSAPALGWVGLGLLAVGSGGALLEADALLQLGALAVAFLLAPQLLRGLPASRATALLLGLHAAGAALCLVRAGGQLLPEGLRTLAWALAAFLLFCAGFLLRARPPRLAGFGVLALTGGRLLLVDLAHLTPDQRILTFLLLGVLLLLVSFSYTRLKGRPR